MASAGHQNVYLLVVLVCSALLSGPPCLDGCGKSWCLCWVSLGLFGVGNLWKFEVCGKFLENLRSFEVFKVKG
jgi:hypothetical protein